MYKRKDLDKLIEESTIYFISNSRFFKPYFEIDPNNFSQIINKRLIEIQHTYEVLSNHYKPVKIFRPDLWTNGPELSIFKLEYYNEN